MTQRGDGGEGREGLGDDQGTRVGSPAPGRSGDSGGSPSGKKNDSGGDHPNARKAGGSVGKGKPTGAGAEAAEGVHTSGERTPDDRTALDDVDTGRGHFDEATVQRAGSEPITREREHKSGYGGEGGSPKQSSDKREPREPEGKAH